jgi:hypothetical protein
MTIEYKYIKFNKEFIEPDDKYNIISCSVFRLIDNYKNENIYTYGLYKLLNNFEKYYQNFYLRVYYDNSVLDYNTQTQTQTKIQNTKKLWQPLFNKLRLNPKVQLVKYEIEQFKFDEIHHKGLIGTLSRLYPLFDTEDNKNINIIMILDIDINDYEIELTNKNLYKFNKSGLNFFYRTGNCYDLQDRFQILTKYFNIKFSIMAGTIISKIKFPIEIFNDFFKCLLDKNNVDCKYYKTFDEFSYSQYHSTSNIKVEFKYGIDEILTLLIKEYLYKNKIKHLIYINTDIAKPFYNMYIAYNKKNISETQFNNTLKYILDDSFDDKISLKDNYKIIDTVIYYQKEYNKLTEKIILDRAKNLINNIKNNKLNKNDFGFDDTSIDCLENSEYDDKYYIIDYIDKFSKDNVQRINFD